MGILWRELLSPAQSFNEEGQLSASSGATFSNPSQRQCSHVTCSIQIVVKNLTMTMTSNYRNLILFTTERKFFSYSSLTLFLASLFLGLLAGSSSTLDVAGDFHHPIFWGPPPYIVVPKNRNWVMTLDVRVPGTNSSCCWTPWSSWCWEGCSTKTNDLGFLVTTSEVTYRSFPATYDTVGQCTHLANLFS